MKNKLKNFWCYQYTTLTGKKVTSLKPIFKHLGILLLLLAIVGVWASFSWGINTSPFAWKNFVTKLGKLFEFSSESTFYSKHYVVNLWSESLTALFQTLKYVIVGTFLGFLLAIISATGTNQTYHSRLYSSIIRNFILVLRAMPELIFITFFTNIFEAYFSLMLIFMWFSWLWLHKYYIEIINNLDIRPYLVAKSQGASTWKAFTKEVWPRIQSRYFALFLYSIESNLRWATVLSTLGVSGIGKFIYYAGNSSANFGELGVPLLLLTIAIIVLEVINILCKKYLFETKTKKIKTALLELTNREELYTRLAKGPNFKKIISSILVLSIALFTIVTLALSDTVLRSPEYAKAMLKAIFTPALGYTQVSMWTQIWQLLQFAVGSVAVMLLFSYLTLPFCSTKLFGTRVAFAMRTITSIFRVIPLIIYFFLFNSIFNSNLLILMLFVGLHQSTSYVKQLWDLVDSLDEEIIRNLKLQNYTRLMIYRRYMLPAVRNDYVSLLLLYFEIAFRDAITYSTLTLDGLNFGKNISIAMNPQAFKPQQAAAYLWIATALILVINLSASALNRYLTKGKQAFKIKNLTLLKFWKRTKKCHKVI
ncbi:ABC transporter permease subunit [Mycoplasmopsis columbinasalis]|uniref:Phosphate-import permease protein phnE n=1 Tax=Mycoplasmopsis columbinasalis TaxID=114880 RepID=A0A449B9P2_9BACT|nr:ABC transporter permease subunit [Mycoplasmopsis columbinasalis]VEU77888.1 Phosphate-import permease protein phnE [Mycoplasmopsis columbinasalis]